MRPLLLGLGIIITQNGLSPLLSGKPLDSSLSYEADTAVKLSQLTIGLAFTLAKVEDYISSTTFIPPGGEKKKLFPTLLDKVKSYFPGKNPQPVEIPIQNYLLP